MASFVWLDGFLGDNVNDKVRLILVESLRIRHPREMLYESIPCMFWNRTANNEMNKLLKGTKVSIRGRVERNEDVGAYILVEHLEYLQPPVVVKPL
ncbi:MAG: hypothetical protein HUJ61_08320 [Bacilli bacterium]|nr:hypothetical protein [Bacilli bacterium]